MISGGCFWGKIKKSGKTRRLVLSTRKPRRRVDNHYFYDANGMRLTKTPERAPEGQVGVGEGDLQMKNSSFQVVTINF